MRKIYNKLIRDKMVDIYKHDIENKINATDFKVHILPPEELLQCLKDKLVEETKELFEAKDTNQIQEEIADIIEVLEAIMTKHGITPAEVLEARIAKRNTRGGFEKGLYLEYIDYI